MAQSKIDKQTEKAFGATESDWKDYTDKVVKEAGPLPLDKPKEKPHPINSVPWYDRPAEATDADKVVGQDDAGNLVYQTVFGTKYLIQTAPDQRTSMAKFKEDTVPAMQEYLSNPTLPTAKQVVDTGAGAAQSMYDTFSIPKKLFTGEMGMGEVTVGDVVDTVTATSTGSLAFTVPEGSLRMFGGASAKGINTTNFDKAEKILKQERVKNPNMDTDIDVENKVSKRIWEQTGWYIDPADKRWRFEVDDSKSGFKTFETPWINSAPDIKTSVVKPISSTPESVTFKVGDVFEHKELFKHYPHLKDYEVSIVEPLSDVTLKGGALGYWSSDTNKFVISKDVANRAGGFRSVMLHELQHGVQDYEGFTKGNNPKNIDPDLLNKDHDALNLAIRKLTIEAAVIKKELEIKYGITQAKLRSGVIPARILNDAEAVDKFNRYNQIDTVEISNLTNKKHSAKYEFYEGTGGEIEARLVQNRSNLNADQRGKSFPGGTTDGPSDSPDIFSRSNQTSSTTPSRVGAEDAKQTSRPIGTAYTDIRIPVKNAYGPKGGLSPKDIAESVSTFLKKDKATKALGELKPGSIYKDGSGEYEFLNWTYKEVDRSKLIDYNGPSFILDAPKDPMSLNADPVYVPVARFASTDPNVDPTKLRVKIPLDAMIYKTDLSTFDPTTTAKYRNSEGLFSRVKNKLVFNEFNTPKRTEVNPNALGSKGVNVSLNPKVSQDVLDAEALLDDPEKLRVWQDNARLPESKRQANPEKSKQAAEDLFQGNITSKESRSIIKDELPNTLFTKETMPNMPTVTEVVGSLGKKSGNNGILGVKGFDLEAGQMVSSRLDIPAYNNYDKWVVSIHDGAKDAGSVVGYGQAIRLKNIRFGSKAKDALDIAKGKRANLTTGEEKPMGKATIARIFGEYVPEDPYELQALASKLLDDPDWVQVGMNPYKGSAFYDKATGFPVMEAQEVIQVGPLVLAKGVKKPTVSQLKELAVRTKDGKIRMFNEGGIAMNEQTEMAFADGGLPVDPVSGNEVPPGSLPEEVRDDIPAQLSEGEYIVPADVLRYFGMKFFEDLRAEAKAALGGMEQDGRMGGEPIGEAPMEAEDDLPFSTEELQATEDTQMSKGGYMRGYAEAGLVTTPNEAAATYPDTQMSSIFGGYGNTGGITYVTYYGPNGETITIQMFNGQPMSPIPSGYTSTPPAVASSVAPAGQVAAYEAPSVATTNNDRDRNDPQLPEPLTEAERIQAGFDATQKRFSDIDFTNSKTLGAQLQDAFAVRLSNIKRGGDTGLGRFLGAVIKPIGAAEKLSNLAEGNAIIKQQVARGDINKKQADAMAKELEDALGDGIITNALTGWATGTKLDEDINALVAKQKADQMALAQKVGKESRAAEAEAERIRNAAASAIAASPASAAASAGTKRERDNFNQVDIDRQATAKQLDKQGGSSAVGGGGVSSSTRSKLKDAGAYGSGNVTGGFAKGGLMTKKK